MGLELAKAWITVRGDNSKLGADLSRSQQVVAGGMARIGQVARDAFAGLGAISIGAALFSASKTVVEFEDSMVQLRINARLLGEEGAATFARLEAKARELGATTRFTASEAAASLNQLVLAGLSVEDALAAVDHVLSGASASGLGLEQSAAILTTQMKIWKFEASELSRVNDTLISGQTRMRTTMAELNEAMSSAGTLAKKVGLSFEQTAAMVGLMIEQGANASTAGTTIGSVLGRIADAPKDFQDSLAQLGMSIDDFKDQTGELNFEKFLNAFRDIELTSAQVTQIFGMRGRQFIKVVDQMDSAGRKGMDAVNALADGMRNDAGMAAEAATARMDTMKGALLSLKSAFEELALSVLTPVIRGFAEVGKAVTVAVRGFAMLNEATGGLIGEAIKVTTAFLTFAYLLPKIITGVRLLGMAIKMQLIGTGFGAVAVAVGVAIVALIQFFKWISKFPQVQEAWAGAVEKLKLAWENFQKAVDTIWKSVVMIVNSAIDVIESALGITIGDIGDSFAEVVADIITMFADFVLEISQWIRVIAENWTLVWELIINKTFAVIYRIGDAVTGLFDFMIEGFKRTGNVIGRFWDYVWQDTKRIFGVGSREAVEAAARELLKAEKLLGSTLRDAFAESDAVKALEARNREIVEQLKRAKADLEQAQAAALGREDMPAADADKAAEAIGKKAGEQMAKAFQLEQGRYGFADFGKAIQDALLGKDKDAERNDLLEEGNKIQDKQLVELRELKDAVDDLDGGGLAPGDA